MATPQWLIDLSCGVAGRREESPQHHHSLLLEDHHSPRRSPSSSSLAQRSPLHAAERRVRALERAIADRNRRRGQARREEHEGLEQRVRTQTVSVDARLEEGKDAFRKGDVELARSCFRAAVLDASHAGDRRGEARAWTNAGNAERKLNKMKQALGAYRKALGIFRKLGDVDLELVVLESALSCATSEGYTEEALGYAVRRLAILAGYSGKPNSGETRSSFSGLMSPTSPSEESAKEREAKLELNRMVAALEDSLAA